MQNRIASSQIRLNSFLIIFLLGQFSIIAQPKERLTGLGGLPIEAKPVSSKKQKTAASLTLPFLDDFSYLSSYPDTALWQDAFVYVNNHLSIDPITQGAVTFDGLNQYGRAYDINKTNSDTTDILTSRPINLSSATDSVIFSFYFQEGGYGELPSSDDFFDLSFYNPTTQQWISVWKELGTSTSRPFELVQIPITDPDLLKDNFQFRFLTSGSSAGAFDQWHLDFVNIREGVGLADDSIFTKVSFIRQAPSILRDYESVPWFHYNDFVETQQNVNNFDLRYRLNFHKDSTLNGIKLGVFDIKIKGAPTPLTSDIGGNINIYLDGNHFINGEAYSFPLAVNPQDFALPQDPLGELEIVCRHSYIGYGVNGLASSDSAFWLVRNQLFKNYYSYDDGTAERAFTVDGNTGGFIVSDYQLANPTGDSLKGLYLYFAPASYDITQNSFSIVVFENNNGLPGNLIYESDSLYSPEFSGNNFYLPYAMDSTIFIQDNAFIGIRQQNNIPLTLGFDLFNIDKTTSFYGTKTDMYESFELGTIMMRPFFRYIPDDIGIATTELKDLEFNLYPNPNTGSFTIDIPGNDDDSKYTYQILNLTGALIQSGSVTQDEIQLNNTAAGIYLLQLNSTQKGSRPTYQKLIITK